MKKIVFCTHQDLDGIGCGIIGKIVAGKIASFVYLNNNEVDDFCDKLMKEHPDTKFLYFTDLCPSEDVLKKLNDWLPNRIKVYDHHKTALHAIDTLGENGVVRCEADENGKMPAGTSLVYEAFREMIIKISTHDPINIKLLDKFVETVRSYDTYQWKTENNIEAKYLQTLFSMLDNDRFTDRFLERIRDTSSKKLIRDAEMDFILTRMNQEDEGIEKILNNRESIKDYKIGPYNVGILFYPGGMAVSELGYRILEKYKELDVILILNMYYNTFNFRASDGNVDATIYAYPLGGGGHPRACGCNIPEGLTRDFFDAVVDKIKSVI